MKILTPLLLLFPLCAPASADVIFSQDFESSPLGANEVVFGNFSTNNSNAPLTNGTQMMGHSTAYGPLEGGTTPQPSYSYYEIKLDLRGWSDVTLSFDFTGGIEKEFDGFNLLAAAPGKVAPPAGLVNPTPTSGMQYGTLVQHGASSVELGPTAWSSPTDPSVVTSVAADFDLADFDDTKVTLRFQFGTDGAEGGDGANFDNILIEGTPLPDSDGDGMHDGYEDLVGLDASTDDRGLDLDGDGVLNGDEYANCTAPHIKDTDEDGLDDNVETNTGIFVDATDTGTNPLESDSDGDTLSDLLEDGSLEFNGAGDPGTNPNLADTDGDTYSDPDEITRGTDPTDASSVPRIPAVIGYWSFDDQSATTADLSANGNDGTVNGDAVFVDGASGQTGDFAIEFDGVDDFVSTDVALLNDLTQFTMSGWVKFDAAQADRTGLFGQNDAVEFGMINSTTMQYWTSVGGAIDVPFGPSAPWTHILVTNNATERVVWIDGMIAGSGTPATTLNSGFNFNIGGGGIYDATGNFFTGQIDEVAVWDSVLAEAQIGQLASGELTPIGPPNRKGLSISTITRDDEGKVVLTWDSRPNVDYAIFWSPDLKSFGNEITDSHPTGGETTSFTNPDLPDGTPRRFYRIEERPRQ